MNGIVKMKNVPLDSECSIAKEVYWGSEKVTEAETRNKTIES